MGKTMICIMLEFMMSMLPLKGCILLNDEYDLLHSMTEEAVDRTGFAVYSLQEDEIPELSAEEIIIIGTAYANLDKIKTITEKLPDQARIFIYCAGGMDHDRIVRCLRRDLKNSQFDFLLVNDDEMSEEQWVKECVDKKLLEIWVQRFREDVHNKTVVSIG